MILHKKKKQKRNLQPQKNTATCMNVCLFVCLFFCLSAFLTLTQMMLMMIGSSDVYGAVVAPCWMKERTTKQTRQL